MVPMLVAETNDFLELVLYAVECTIYWAGLIWSHWYFRLLLVSGMVWLGLDVFQILADTEHENKFW